MEWSLVLEIGFANRVRVSEEPTAVQEVAWASRPNLLILLPSPCTLGEGLGLGVRGLHCVLIGIQKIAEKRTDDSRLCRSTYFSATLIFPRRSFFHDIVEFDDEMKIRLGRDRTAGSSAIAITKLIRNL